MTCDPTPGTDEPEVLEVDPFDDATVRCHDGHLVDPCTLTVGATSHEHPGETPDVSGWCATCALITDVDTSGWTPLVWTVAEALQRIRDAAETTGRRR